MKASVIRPAARIEQSHLQIGKQVFHNGTPVELLYRVARDTNQETWRVRPLFVEAPDRNEKFRPSDLITYLHTIRTHTWCRAA
jgi:hypothetical protein